MHVSSLSGTSEASSRRNWRSLLPIEHGGWSLVGEPILLGLMAAASVPGGALAVAALAAFLARRPLALARGSGPSRQLARRALVICALAGATGLSVAGWIGPAEALLGLLVAVPPAGVFIILDTRKQARAGEAELAGVAAFAVVPGVMALLNHWPPGLAAALAFTALARSVPVVIMVRMLLRLRRGEAVRPAIALLVNVAFVVAAAGLSLVEQLPWAVTALAVVQMARTSWMLGPRGPAWPARRIGAVEAVIGAIHVLIVGVAWRMAG
jgi:hypothetical protein